jgi:hypothetical protein
MLQPYDRVELDSAVQLPKYSLRISDRSVVLFTGFNTYKAKKTREAVLVRSGKVVMV